MFPAARTALSVAQTCHRRGWRPWRLGGRNTPQLHREAAEARMLSSAQYQSLVKAVNTTARPKPTAAPDVPYDIVLAVWRQLQFRSILRNSKYHRDKVDVYVGRFKAGETLFAIAADVRWHPFLLARYMIEVFCGSSGAGSNNSSNSSNSSDGKDSSKQQAVPERKTNWVSKCCKDPRLISDATLRAQVEQAMVEDVLQSPLVDRIKHDVGLQYELLLTQQLNVRGIRFEREQALGEQGFPKTPDAKLTEPIVVLSPQGRPHLVHWIDSKGEFGEPDMHSRHLKQYYGYVSRFGPGLVVYWHGYVDTLNSDPSILVLNGLPSQWTWPASCLAAPVTWVDVSDAEECVVL